MSVDIAKSELCSIPKSRCLGKHPSTVLSIDTVFESTPNVTHLSAILVVSFAFSSWMVGDDS